MILSGSAVQLKGLGFLLVSATKRLTVTAVVVVAVVVAYFVVSGSDDEVSPTAGRGNPSSVKNSQRVDRLS
jgi:hypothetical protein